MITTLCSPRFSSRSTCYLVTDLALPHHIRALTAYAIIRKLDSCCQICYDRRLVLRQKFGVRLVASVNSPNAVCRLHADVYTAKVVLA